MSLGNISNYTSVSLLSFELSKILSRSHRVTSTKGFFMNLYSGKKAWLICPSLNHFQKKVTNILRIVHKVKPPDKFKADQSNLSLLHFPFPPSLHSHIDLVLFSLPSPSSPPLVCRLGWQDKRSGIAAYILPLSPQICRLNTLHHLVAAPLQADFSSYSEYLWLLLRWRRNLSAKSFYISISCIG